MKFRILSLLVMTSLSAEPDAQATKTNEAESKLLLRNGDVSDRPYEWASGGKALWLRNAGDSISLALPKTHPDGYYSVRLRGRSLAPLSHGYILETGTTRERFRLTGERMKLPAPVNEVAWFEVVLFLKSSTTFKISNVSAWALIDVITMTPTVLKEKIVEAESLSRKGTTSVAKTDWASAGSVVWLKEAWSSLICRVGGLAPGNYRVDLKVRDHPSLRNGYFLLQNGLAAYLEPAGDSEPVSGPMQKMIWLSTQLHLQQGDELELFHLRHYAAVDCIRYVPIDDHPPIEVAESIVPPRISDRGNQQQPTLNPVTFHEPAQHKPVWLVHNGKPAASIVVSPKIDKRETSKSIMNGFPFSVHAAARELQHHIELSTGVKLPILIDRLPERGNAVLVGASRFTEEFDQDLDSAGASAFTIRTFPGKIVIAGRDGNLGDELVNESGTLWGVHDFLERFVGVRWYYPGEMGRVVPITKNLAVLPVHITDEPHFKKRRIWRYHGTLKNTPPGNSAVMGARFRNEDVSGTSSSAHTFSKWRKLYGKTHPEYFEMGKDGTRKSSQLCFSAPGVLQQMLKNIETDERNTIAVSPIDVALKCQCNTCLTKVNRQSFLFEYSQVMGEFVHALAREVKKRWPDKTVYYLAYQNYVAPPKGLEFPDNVQVMICGMRTIANYKEPEIYGDEKAIFDGWQRILKKPTSHWHYMCWPDDCTSAPFQFRHVLKEFFTRYSNTIGAFVDSGIDWPRKHLSVYFLTRLLWNPEFDVDAAFDEYCRLMYGPASDPVQQIFELLTNRWERSRWSHPLPPYHRISLKNVHVETYPPEVVNEMKQLYDDALAAVDTDSMEARRIRFLGISLESFFKESDGFHRKSARRKLRVHSVETLPVIDGKLNDAQWTGPKDLQFRKGYDATGGEPDIKTTARAIWTTSGIVLGLTGHEPDMKNIRTNKTGHDEQVFLDDCFEIFIDSRGELGDYFQIVINSKGAVFDASSLGDPYSSWNCEGLKVGIERGKDSWTAEVFIPFKAVNASMVKPGTSWYGNITRSRWNKGFQLYRLHTVDVPPIKTSNLNMLHFAQFVFE